MKYVNLKKIAMVHFVVTLIAIAVYLGIGFFSPVPFEEPSNGWVFYVVIIGASCVIMSLDGVAKSIERNAFGIAAITFFDSFSVIGPPYVRTTAFGLLLLGWAFIALRTNSTAPLLLEARDEKYDGIFSVENGVAKTGVFCVGAVEIVIIWLTVSLCYFFSKSGL